MSWRQRHGKRLKLTLTRYLRANATGEVCEADREREGKAWRGERGKGMTPLVWRVVVAMRLKSTGAWTESEIRAAVSLRGGGSQVACALLRCAELGLIAVLDGLKFRLTERGLTCESSTA